MENKIVDCELCDKCQKNMDKALTASGVLSASVTDIIENQAIIPFSLAVDLAAEGHHVRRVNEQYPFTIVKVFRDPEHPNKSESLFAVKDDKNLERILYYKGSFTTEEILAVDYIVVI